MSFHQYLALPTVVELSSTNKVDAIKELAQALCRALGIRRHKSIVAEILKREDSASTFIGQGVAIPHTRGPIKDDYAIAVGRSVAGISFDAARGALAHTVVLVISRESEADNLVLLDLLAEIASCFKSDMIRDKISATEMPVDILSLITSFEVPEKATPRQAYEPIVKGAVELARSIKAGTIVVFSDAILDNDFLDSFKGRHRLIVVTSNKTRFAGDDKRMKAVIQAPAFQADRLGQIKIGLLLAVSRNLVKKEDKVVCVSGNPKSGVFDTIVAIDIDREYEFFLTAAHSVLPPDVEPEVLERVLGLAGEIAVEGREGKPVGTIFVVGDTNSVNAYVRQLIINPFRGYSEAERNIMDPGLDETIKEFSGIDGAFVITGDGIVLSAGSYLKPQAEIQALPGGLGARHVAAAAITACTNALAITVSESTGTVTLFKNGAIMMSLAKPMAPARSAAHRDAG